MIEHVQSYYAATANPAPARPPLRGEEEADVCVIGAGYAGLSTALHLAQRGYKVAVLEAAKVGWGASGRNGGQIVNGYSRDLETIQKRYGDAAAKALGDMALEGGRIIRAWIETYDIACHYRPTNLFAAFTAKQMRALARSCANWSRRGHDGLQLLDQTELRRYVQSECYVGGALDRHGGHLHPLNLALGEAAAAESLGVRIFEQTSVTGVETMKGKAQVVTAHGRVRAPVAVACGNAYLNGVVPFLTDKVMPVSTQVVTTEILGADRIDALFPTRTAVEDVNYVLDYYRPTADDRLLFGGGIVYGGAEPANIEARLRPRLAKLFPDLANVRFDYLWSGNFALTLTRIPHFGRIGSNLYFAHGCSGHGVTTMHLAGRLIADAIHGDVTRFDAFADLPYHPFPGGRLFRVPLTILGAWWYRLRDRLGV